MHCGHPHMPRSVQRLRNGPAAGVSSPVCMSSRSERRAAREAVAVYHEARLAELVQHVGDAVDRFRAGELDAFETDQVVFQYSRARGSCGSSATFPTPSSPLA